MAADSRIRYYTLTKTPEGAADTNVYVVANVIATGDEWTNTMDASGHDPLEDTLEALAVELSHSFGL